MTKTILGMDAAAYCARLKRRKRICFLTAGLTAAVLTALVLCFPEGRDSLPETACVILTVLCGWFLVAFGDLVIRPEKRLLMLFLDGGGQTWEGRVISVSEKTESDHEINCFCVRAATDAGEKQFHLPRRGAIELKIGASYVFTVKTGIIVAAQVNEDA